MKKRSELAGRDYSTCGKRWCRRPEVAPGRVEWICKLAFKSVGLDVGDKDTTEIKSAVVVFISAVGHLKSAGNNTLGHRVVIGGLNSNSIRLESILEG